jgi:hypothetical protein
MHGVFWPQGRWPTCEEEIQGVKTGYMLARFIGGDLLLELFTPDLPELADVFVCDVHRSDDTPQAPREIGGGHGRPRRFISTVGW